MDEVNDIYADDRSEPDPLTREHAIEAMDAAVHALREDVSRGGINEVVLCWQELLEVIGGPSAVG